jgi:pyridoxamine 5'-phosphate oxidase
MEIDKELRLADLRLTYQKGGLMEDQVSSDPMEQFSLWMEEAVRSSIVEPNAMSLATVDESGRPSVRTVLLKGLDDRGLHFYTNRKSRKGRELAERPDAAVVFFWRELERQITIRGIVSEMPREEVAEYFASRPYESQIGAWVSLQSEVIESREWLEARDRDFRETYPEGQVPLPEIWGGYLLDPFEMEFWQGRPGRLHDRLRYTRDASNWKRERLCP